MFAKSFSNGVNAFSNDALYAHRFFLRAGLAIANVFAWVFVFEYFSFLSGNFTRGFAATALLYGLAQLLTLVATPISAAHLRRGTKHSLIWGVVLAAAAFVYLGATLSGTFVFSTNASFGWGIALFALLLGMYRALYWVPYKLTAVHAPHHHMKTYLEVFIALMPLFAGMTLVAMPLGHLHLLYGAAALIALSAIPALFLKDVRERFSWSYVYTFRQLYRSKNQGFVLHALFEGMQGAALFLAWPIIVFIIVGGSYVDLGLIFTITLLLVMVLRKIYGWFVGTYGLSNSTVVPSVIAVSAWIMRLAAGTTVGIVIADVYSHATRSGRGVQADPLSHEQSGDHGTFVDEYTALKEMALALGRIMFCVLLFVLPLFFTMTTVFAIALVSAAVAAGIATVIARHLPATAY